MTDTPFQLSKNQVALKLQFILETSRNLRFNVRLRRVREMRKRTFIVDRETKRHICSRCARHEP